MNNNGRTRAPKDAPPPAAIAERPEVAVARAALVPLTRDERAKLYAEFPV